MCGHEARSHGSFCRMVGRSMNDRLRGRKPSHVSLAKGVRDPHRVNFSAVVHVIGIEDAAAERSSIRSTARSCVSRPGRGPGRLHVELLNDLYGQRAVVVVEQFQRAFSFRCLG
jgi:hypothetical protein